MKVFVKTNYIENTFIHVDDVIVGNKELRLRCGTWVYIFSLQEVIEFNVEEESKNV